MTAICNTSLLVDLWETDEEIKILELLSDAELFFRILSCKFHILV